MTIGLAPVIGIPLPFISYGGTSLISFTILLFILNRLDEIAFEERVVNVRKKYKNEFGHALTDDRVNQFFKADKEFTNSVRQELQERQMLQLRQQSSRLKQN